MFLRQTDNYVVVVTTEFQNFYQSILMNVFNRPLSFEY